MHKAMGHAGLTAVVFTIIVVTLCLTGCAIFRARETVITTGFGYWIPDSLVSAAAQYHDNRLRTFYLNPTQAEAEACWRATQEVYGIISYGVYIKTPFGMETFIPYEKCPDDIKAMCDSSLIHDVIEVH